MAKLSLKGVVSLSHQIIKDGKTNTHNVELFQDDFEDCVMLTVEEAKKWMRILHENAPYLDCLYESSKDDYLFLEEISKRIEQAEKPQ